MIKVMQLKLTDEGTKNADSRGMYSRVAFALDQWRSVSSVCEVLNDQLGWAEKGLSFSTVAEVEADSSEDVNDQLEHAFRATNSIDSVWWSQPLQGVKPIGEGHRSTSVGDVMAFVSGNERRLYAVAPLGFVEITDECQ